MYALHSHHPNSLVLATDCLNLVIRDEKDNYAIYADHQLDLAVMGVHQELVRDVANIFGNLIYTKADAYNDLFSTFHPTHHNKFPNYFNQLEYNYSPQWRMDG